MTTTLLKVVADLNLSLASAVSAGSTTATLNTNVDSDGVTLPDGKFGFTVDGDNSSKEFFVCDKTGTAITNVQSISKQGAATTGFSTYHRTGAVITITDWAVWKRAIDNLNGTTGFDSGTALSYDGQPLLSDPTAIPTVQFVLDTASGGAVTFDATVIAGDAGENVADGDWVYFNTTDGEWYKTDADDTTKCLGVQIGKARGAGTNGNPITGGIFVAGLEKVGTYVAGTTYYLGNTAGALSTSAGTNSVVVGVGDANGDLILKKATPNQVDALAGTPSTPTSVNKFVVQAKQVVAGATINGATLPVPVYQNTTDNEYYACDGNDLAALKYQGFAITNGVDGGNFLVQMNGIVGGFSGLDEGVAYYLSDTVGTIQNTPGTYSVLVGVAISPTELLIQKGKHVFSGNGGDMGIGTSSLAVNCGFRPTLVRINAMFGSSSTISVMNATWANGAMTAVASAYNEGSAGTTNNLARIYDDSVSDYFEFSITAVTNTGFTINWTESGSMSGGSYFYYEAEGDL